MSIQRMRISSGAIAAAGTATAYSTLISGRIMCVHINYPANVCEVDLDTYGENVSQKIMDVASGSRDIVYYPRVQLVDNTGANLDTSDAQGGDVKKYGEFVVNGKIKLSIAAGTAAQIVTVDVIYEN